MTAAARRRGPERRPVSWQAVEALPVPPASPAPPERRTLALVSASHAVQHMYSTLLPLTYPAVVVAFRLSFQTLGLAVGVVGLVGGLMQGLAGLVSRWIQPRWLLGGQNILLGVFSALGGLAPTYVAYASAQGAAVAAASQQHPVGAAVLSKRYPTRRGMALSTHVIAGNVGSLLVPLPAAVLLLHLGWRATLLLFAIPLVLMGVVLAVGLPASITLRRPQLVPTATPGAPGAVVGGPRFLDRRTAILVIGAGMVAAGGRGLGTLAVFVPLYLRDGAHLPILAVGGLYNLMLLAGAIGPLVAGRLSDRVGRRRVLWAAYGLSACVVSAYGFAAHTPLALVPLTVLVGAFAYAESPLLQAALSDAVAPGSQATVFGIFFACAYGLGSLWVVGLGAIISHVGFAPAFVVMGASYVGAGLLLIPTRPRPRAAAAA